MGIGNDPGVNSFKKFWNILKYIFRPAHAIAYVALFLHLMELNHVKTFMGFLFLMRFYTLINLALNIVYYVLAVLLDLLKQKRMRTTLSLLAFTSSSVTGILYWALELWSPGATVSCEHPLITKPWWPHVAHTWPALANFVDLLVSKPERPHYRQAMLCILAITFAYGIFIDANARRGVYIYDFIKNLTQSKLFIFYFIVLGVVFVCFSVIVSISFILYMMSNEKQNSDEPSDPPKKWYHMRSAPKNNQTPSGEHKVPNNNYSQQTQQHHYFFHNIKFPSMKFGSSSTNKAEDPTNNSTKVAPQKSEPKSKANPTSNEKMNNSEIKKEAKTDVVKNPDPGASIINMIPFAASMNSTQESTTRTNKIANYFARKKSDAIPPPLNFDEE